VGPRKRAFVVLGRAPDRSLQGRHRRRSRACETIRPRGGSTARVPSGWRSPRRSS